MAILKDKPFKKQRRAKCSLIAKGKKQRPLIVNDIKLQYYQDVYIEILQTEVISLIHENNIDDVHGTTIITIDVNFN